MVLWFDDEDRSTLTSTEQCRCEVSCAGYLGVTSTSSNNSSSNSNRIDDDDDDDDDYDDDDDDDDNNAMSSRTELVREKHVMYLRAALAGLGSGFVTLDSSRPWICYWVTHALHLLDSDAVDMFPNLIRTLSLMQNTSTGGFGGNISQESHCAPTYAAVLCLCTVGTKQAFDIINRTKLYDFFLSLKVWMKGSSRGYAGFRMHADGEIDVRGTYTVLAVARLLNILTPELVDGVADFILACATYEGGFGGEPGNEAHGGYNFCALAGLLILGETEYSRIDLDAQEHWLMRRQMQIEGGFQGRTNKLVDACYSFWQGASASIVSIMRAKGTDISDLVKWRQQQRQESDTQGSYYLSKVRDSDGKLSFNQKKLQKYIIRCGQSDNGGLRDKPGKSRDYYHSCYALSGLSIAQWSSDTDTNDFNVAYVYGDVSNVVLPTSVAYNIGLDRLHAAYQYFHETPKY